MSAPEKIAAPPSDDLAETAADWLVRRSEGLDEAARQAFLHWLNADPRHAAAYARVEQTWAALNAPRAAGQADELALALTVRARGRRQRHAFALAGIGLTAAAALVAGLFVNRPIPQNNAVPVETAASTIAPRPDRRTLPDGSVVELNAGAEIEVAFTAERRLVRLRQGEALFEVAKNPARPFVVATDDVTVTAVGTAFAVRRAALGVDVLVTEGKVAVARPDAAESAPVLLTAGHRVSVPADPRANELPAPEIVEASRIGESLAWRDGRVEFTETPLAEAVRLLNARNRLQLVIGDASLASLRLSGIFWANDPEAFVRLLGEGMAVRAERRDDGIVLHR